MGAGLSKEHRVLPLAVTALSPEQRRSRLDRRRRPDQPRPLLHHHHHQPPQVDDAPAAPAAALPGPEQPSAAVRGSVSPQQLLQQPVAQQQRQSQGLRLSKLLPRRKQAVATLDLFDEDSPWWDPYLPDESARISPADGRDFAEGAPHDQTSPASPRSPGAAGIPFRNRPPTVIAAAAPPRSNAGVVVSLAGPVGRRKSRKLYPYAFSELQSTVDINLCSLGILKLSPHIGLLRSAVTMQL
ncbi:MAG: hypothetical protein BJ554DRAFT_6977 [Olpidium bornovanus]|uniref:Uncharacterized protein n=1 Tax=Olpidium bornovanus TaxID=278681 RepID=A0A8H7ZWU4_9FUNG|nr:MAG: hypothetical protein BJ554DRAFT_6977 [Olpidium bornovanus]